MPLDSDAILAMFAAVLDEMGQDEVKELNGSHQLRDVGMDSLELIEFFMAVQDRTGVEVTSEEVTSETSFGEIAQLIIRKSA